MSIFPFPVGTNDKIGFPYIFSGSAEKYGGSAENFRGSTGNFRGSVGIFGGSKFFCRGSWNALRQVKIVGVFCLAEIKGIMQFLQHDKLCPLLGGFSDSCFNVREVLCDFLHTLMLYDAYFHGKYDFFLQR